MKDLLVKVGVKSTVKAGALLVPGVGGLLAAAEAAYDCYTVYKQVKGRR